MLKNNKKIFFSQNRHLCSMLVFLCCCFLFFSQASFARLDRSQNQLRRNIYSYLVANNAEKEIIRHFKNYQFDKNRPVSGSCYGLAVSWLRSMWLQIQPNAYEDPRYDNDWFKSTVDLIASWDGERELSSEEKLEFKRFISQIDFLQINQPELRKGNPFDFFVDTTGKNLRKVYSISGSFDKHHLMNLLGRDDFIREGDPVLIFSRYHATALFKRQDVWYYFDSTSSSGASVYARYVREDHMVDDILESNGLETYSTSPISLYVFSSEERTYPAQSEVFDELFDADRLGRLSSFDVPYDDWDAGLVMAIVTNCLESAKYYLSRVADVNARDSKGLVPIMHAAKAGDLDMINLLLDKGADDSIETTLGFNAGFFACFYGNVEAAKILKKGPVTRYAYLLGLCKNVIDSYYFVALDYVDAFLNLLGENDDSPY